jgi:hypothetical protein
MYRLDSTANPRSLTKLPNLDEAAEMIEKLGDTAVRYCVEELALMLYYDGCFRILDEPRLLRCTRREVKSVIRWIAYRSAAASDSIVRKKSLRQPEWTVGVVEVAA